MPLAPTLRTFVCVLNQHVIIQPALCPRVLQVHSSRGCCPGTGVTFSRGAILPTQSISDLVHPNQRATSTRQAAQVSIYHSSVACDGASALSTATIYTGGEHLIKKFVLIQKKKEKGRGLGMHIKVMAQSMLCTPLPVSIVLFVHYRAHSLDDVEDGQMACTFSERSFICALLYKVRFYVTTGM